MSALSTLGDLTLQISKGTGNLLSTKYYYDQLLQFDELKEKTIQKMEAEAAAIKAAADKIVAEVQHIKNTYEKRG